MITKRKLKDRSRTKLNISSGVAKNNLFNERPDPIIEEEYDDGQPPPSYESVPQFKYREQIVKKEKDTTGINWLGLYGLYNDVKKERDMKDAYNKKNMESIKEFEKQTKDILKEQNQPKINVVRGTNDEYKYNVSVLNKLEDESFDGWSEEAKSGYLTACMTIKQKYIDTLNGN